MTDQTFTLVSDESGDFVVTKTTYQLEAGPWVDGNMVTWVEFVARAFVVSHLDYNGSWRKNLTPAQWRMAYVRCDGFGKMSYQEAGEVEYDWSHVRDSSPQAFVEVANLIIGWHWTDESIEVTAARVLQAADNDRGEFDPIQHVRNW